MEASFFTYCLLGLSSQRFLRDIGVGDCSQMSHGTLNRGILLGWGQERGTIKEMGRVSDMKPESLISCSPDHTGS